MSIVIIAGYIMLLVKFNHKRSELYGPRLVAIRRMTRVVVIRALRTDFSSYMSKGCTVRDVGSSRCGRLAPATLTWNSKS